MELAVNTFTKGLLMDTHPMILGNDTLTDCLNGTLVTMNGNEVILQNDMGNRRVDNAFLPSGYLPVGMKEYGGVIYVAAYNPITNKSQIGSFPSPLKKINILNNSELGGLFNFNKFFYNSNIESDSNLAYLKVLKSDSFMIPLTKDISLRAGDKFIVYSSDLFDLEIVGNITNYYNTITIGETKYVKSPKNKKYTLQLGILNSLNEFVDITKTLLRWDYDESNDESYLKKYDSSYSDLYKFNDGYFIARSFNNDNFEETQDDANLILSRQAFPANTYSYKLIGPLYLKANLNHIDNFNYNIYGYKNENSVILYIEGFLTYNCPDEIDENAGELIGEYRYSGEGIPQFNGFDLFKVENNNIVKKLNLLSSTRSANVYNLETNLYSTKIVKTCELNETNGVFEYVLGVNASDSTYIRGLSDRGSINIDLLGSGNLEFNGWKFYNNERETTLTFSFDAYPKYEEEFNNLRFEFVNINNSDNELPHWFPEEGTLPLYNGRQTYIFNWEDIGLNPRKVYKVITHYNVLNKNTGVPKLHEVNGENTTDYTVEDKRWLLTTKLFNEFYPASSGISDFCTTNDSEFKKKMDIYLDVEDNISNLSESSENFEGGMIGKQEDVWYKCEHTYNIDITSSPTLKILNEELYPDFIKISSDNENSVKINNITVKLNDKEVNNSNIISIFKGYLQQIENGSINTIENTWNTDTTNNNIISITESKESLSPWFNISNNKVKGYIKYWDLYLSRGKTNFEVTNAFGKVLDLIKEACPKDNYYGGIWIDYTARNGHNDDHDIYVCYKLNKIKIGDLSLLGSDHLTNLFNEHDDSKQNVSFKDLESLVFDEFNEKTEKGLMFIYTFLNNEHWFSILDNDASRLPLVTGYVPINGNNYTRVWWRCSDGTWALFRNLFTNNRHKTNNKNTEMAVTDAIANDLAEDVKSQLLNEFPTNEIYCMYNSAIIKDLWAASIDNIYYDEYSIPLIFYVFYEITSSLENIISIKASYSDSNLEFVRKEEMKQSNEISFKLNSSKSFQTTIKNFNLNNISNIDLGSGLMYDSDNLALNPNYRYKIKENGRVIQLEKVKNSYMLIDLENTLYRDDKVINTLTYNRNTTGNPLYKYDHGGQVGGDWDKEHNHTVLDYSSVNIVSGIK